MVSNSVNLVGLLKRIDVREFKSKNDKDLLTATLTLVINTDEVRVDMFSMRYKKDGDEMSSATAIYTLLNEAKALHKTIKKGDKDAVEVKENIVEKIEDCEIIKCSSYKDFKYCRLEMNVYKDNTGVVKNSYRITANYVNRGKESEEYKPNNIFEIAGKVITPVVEREEKDGTPFVTFSMLVPVFNKGYTKADGEVVEDRVDLQQLELKCHNEDAFDYIMDNFETGGFVYVNGTIKRCQVVVEQQEETEQRGFGRKVEHKPQTEILSYLEVEGGYELDGDDLENVRAFDEEIWEQGEKDYQEKIDNLGKDDRESKPQKGFGKTNKETNSRKLPF